MSTDYYAYVGPYIRIKRTKVKGTEKIRCCGKSGCSKERKEVWDEQTKFCPKCGGKIDTKEYVVDQDKYDHYDVMGVEHEDQLFYAHNGGEDKKDHFLMPNHEGPREFNVEPRCSSVEIDLPEGTREKELAWFEKKYKEEIALIKEVVGDEMTLCWGVVTHAS